MARGFSPAYRAYHNSPRWRARKAAHWAHPLTLKSCVVCGARRRPSEYDHHELIYRTAGEGEDRVMLDPPWWAVVPACQRPCHRWLITPLSRSPWVRRVLVVVGVVAALRLGVPVRWSAGGALVVLALPRIAEATLLMFLLGLPVRVGRWAVRARRA